MILKAPRRYKSMGTGNYIKNITIQSLRIIEMSNAHLNFRPSPDYQNVLITECIHFNDVLKLRFTKEARCQPLLILKGTYLGNLFIALPTLAYKH